MRLSFASQRTALCTTSSRFSIKPLALAQPQQKQQQRRTHTAAAKQQQQGQAQPLDAATFWARSLLQLPSSSGSSTTYTAAACGALTLGAALLALLPAEAAHAAAHGADVHAQLAALNPSVPDFAEGQEFWGNVVRYGRYFITVMLGTGYVMLRPLFGLFKNPVTGVLAVAAIAGAVYGTKLTLDAMLGLSEPFEYLPPAKAGF